MFAPVGFAEPRLVQCQRCRGTGNERRYGITPCVACDGVGGHNADDWPLATLAHNLAVAGAMMVAALYAELRLTHGIEWMPGCGVEAPGWDRRST